MDVALNKKCGIALANMRKDNGLTQIELAKRLNKPQSFVSKIETGERSLRLYEQFSYANALGLPISEFCSNLERALGLREN